ncbi:hypothetical protein PICMEDRAFT_85513 [Pichia membranifaciens NRRL Y-2026]|uniref:Uncharacterized protein n=1 Tax=Pichia membranifaciens NRRL Y-2026 TaxID=763406 RepID=A0A1E3NRH7_9ASCO|nr:hypothetical protein PICMEDRAFT_85513 [Pichia membranifaciens NRRL Y-2026]ODQ48674.1 hypothetical protein PICMEDRAFT_85513 [Pichia membranifaciens NRRL Y-2026]
MERRQEEQGAVGIVRSYSIQPQVQKVKKSIAMCRPATCDNCKKTAWVGCGLHIPAAMEPISKDERCTCAHPADSATSKDYPPKVGTGIPQN